MNQRVFVVFAGEYSGRRIDAVFDTRQLAEEYIVLEKETFDEFYDIEEHEVNANES